MSLLYPDGHVFTTAVTPYRHEPFTERETTDRIIVHIELLGLRTRAMVDTGGTYLLCTHELASLLDFDRFPALQETKIGFYRLGQVAGTLYRVPLAIMPEAGTVQPVEVTTFVPSDSSVDGGLPYPILGYHCCLERTRFAVDPFEERFYFGNPEVSVLDW